jgi:hypothetical protein
MFAGIAVRILGILEILGALGVLGAFAIVIGADIYDDDKGVVGLYLVSRLLIIN